MSVLKFVPKYSGLNGFELGNKIAQLCRIRLLRLEFTNINFNDLLNLCKTLMTACMFIVWNHSQYQQTCCMEDKTFA